MAGLGSAAEPFRFPEGKHGKGQLKYIKGIPVLVVAGTPEEIGTQMGVLALKPAAGAVQVFKEVLKEHRLDLLSPILTRLGETQLAKYPEGYRREFEALAKASGVDRNLLLIANSLGELRHLAGCSALMIDAGRSTTGGPLMGRNWDFPPVKGIHAYSLLIVYRPEGKKAFATVSFPGAVAAGCEMSALNEAGLAMGGNFIGRSADQAPAVDWTRTPSAVVARRALEECATITEAEKLVRACRPAERGAVVGCDRSGGGVLEITSKTIVLRRGTEGICVGTNHFVTKGLAVPGSCWRWPVLLKAGQMGQLGVADVARKMHEANQGAWTAHTMVIEPRPLKIHLAFGDGKKSATEFPLREIDLGKLMKP
jgi:hypothetical protein